MSQPAATASSLRSSMGKANRGDPSSVSNGCSIAGPYSPSQRRGSKAAIASAKGPSCERAASHWLAQAPNMSLNEFCCSVMTWLSQARVQVPAVHHENAAGHVARGVGSEQQEHPIKLLGATEPPLGDAVDQRQSCIGSEELTIDVGLD